MRVGTLQTGFQSCLFRQGSGKKEKKKKNRQKITQGVSGCKTPMASAKLKLFEEVVEKTEAMVFQRSQGSDRKLVEASCCLCASSVAHRTGTWDTPPHFGGPVPDPGDRMEQETMQWQAEDCRSVPVPPDGRRNKDTRTEQAEEDSNAVWRPKEQNGPSFL